MNGKEIMLDSTGQAIATKLEAVTTALNKATAIAGPKGDKGDTGEVSLSQLNSALEPKADITYVDGKDTYVRRDIQTSEFPQLKEAIASGNPEKFGFHEGDYFNVNGYTYVLADYDHWYGSYDSNSVVSKRHWGVLVNTGATHAWNSNGSTNGGYVASELHAYLVDTVLPKIEADLTPLGLSLIANQRLYSTAMDSNRVNRYGTLDSNNKGSGASSSWGWSADQKISAPTEIEIYGSIAWSSSGYDTGEGCKPLKACQRFRYNELLPWKYFWLRDIATASYACYANYYGTANYHSVTYAGHVVGLIGIY